MHATSEDALEAHGGTRNWSQLERITALVSLDGPFWASKGWPGVHLFQKVTLYPDGGRIEFAPFTSPDGLCVVDADEELISIFSSEENSRLKRIDIREPPPALFDDEASAWSAVQLAQFTGLVMWNHLLMPCAVAWGDAQVHEIAPWIDGDQLLRRLAIDHPSVRSRNAPILSFDEQFTLRRLDYRADGSTGISIAHHFIEHKVFGGVLLPKRSRIHLLRDDGHGLNERAPITIDLIFANIERKDLHHG